MRNLAIVTTCLMLSSSVFAQSIGDQAKDLGEKTGANSVIGVSPTTSAFVTKAARQRYVRDQGQRDGGG